MGWEKNILPLTELDINSLKPLEALNKLLRVKQIGE
jgi:hypothetical protein